MIDSCSAPVTKQSNICGKTSLADFKQISINCWWLLFSDINKVGFLNDEASSVLLKPVLVPSAHAASVESAGWEG